MSHWALCPAGGALIVFIQVRGLRLEAAGLVQNPGRCTDCSGCGSECDHSVVFALRASLEGEGTEVSEAIQPGMVHGTYKGCRSESFQANCLELKHVIKITGIRNLKQKQNMPGQCGSVE